MIIIIMILMMMNDRMINDSNKNSMLSFGETYHSVTQVCFNLNPLFT